MEKRYTFLLAIILVLLGLLGFVSNPLIGENALFLSNGAYNWFHLLLGLATLMVSIYER